MKFNSLATILIGTVALASNFNAGQANAINCTNTELLYVQWRWELGKFGDFDSSVKAERLGKHPNLSSDPDSDTLGGSFVVSLFFDEPTSHCGKLDDAPTENSLSVTGAFSGLLSTTFGQIPIEGVEVTKLARATPSLNITPKNADSITLFDPKEDEVTLLQWGERKIKKDREKVITVKNKDRISFDGNLDAEAIKGISLLSANFSRASAELEVSGALIEQQSGWVRYKIPTESTPEPLTMLASATAVGFGAFFKRQNSKNQKKS